MKPRIAIIDYEMGNLRSVTAALRHLGAGCEVVSEPDKLADADGLILPGVGAFGDAAQALENNGLLEPVRQAAAAAAAGGGRPFLGICLGLQLLFESSEESPGVAGLGVLPGRNARFSARLPDGTPLKIPHMGWNSVHCSGDGPPPAAVAEGEFFYFVHSYYPVPAEKPDLLLECEYGGVRFAAMAGRGRLYATQFHPEKSQAAGLRLLAAFLELCQ